MANPLTRGVLMGLGMALRTKDAVEAFARKLVDESSMNEEEGKRFVDDLLHQSEETRQGLNRMIEDRVRQILKDMGIAGDKDLQKLEARVAGLEAEMQVLRSASGGAEQKGTGA